MADRSARAFQTPTRERAALASAAHRHGVDSPEYRAAQRAFATARLRNHIQAVVTDIDLDDACRAELADLLTRKPA